MKEVIENDVVYSEELFRKSLKIIQQKGGNKYEFILKGGESYKNALSKLFKVVWETEEKPEGWKDSVLFQLDKGKSDKKDLSNKRFIHLKDDVPRLFGHIVTTAVKPTIMSNMPKNQIGTVPGHRAQENLFVVKSVIGVFEKWKKAISIQFFDITKFFDKESLRDGLRELYKSNMKGKLYRLLYLLNKDTRICVRTPVGDTEKVETREGLAQGSSEGAIASASNLGHGVEDFFLDSEHEAVYGRVPVGPVILQDDICRVAVSPEAAQAGVSKMEAMAETKQLNFNEDKSVFVIFGKGKAKREMEENFKENPVLLYGKPMKCAKSERFLGDQMGETLGESISATLNKRIGRATQSIYEIRDIVDDFRAKITGGIMTGLHIWEMAVIPFLLNNSSTWFSMKRADLERLNRLQNLFFSVLFKVQHSPSSSFLWDCKTLTMENRILKNKLMLCHHILSLPSSAVSRQILEEQISLRFPGLWLEIEDFLVSNEICDITRFSKKHWKVFVDELLSDKNKNDLIKHMKTSSKICQTSILSEAYELKNYITEQTPEFSRVKYRQRYFMLKEAKLNFPSDPSYKAQGFCCDYCPSISSQDHLKVCSEFYHLREGRDLEIDTDFIQYIIDVIKYRQDREEDDAEIDD